MLKIEQHARTKVSNTNLKITENQLKLFLKKKTMGDDTKETERLTKTQGLTKDFTSYKIRCKYLRKKVLQLVKAINY